MPDLIISNLRVHPPPSCASRVNRLRELQEKVADEKGLSADALRRMLAKVEEYSESHRAMGLPDDLLRILKDDAADRELVAI